MRAGRSDPISMLKILYVDDEADMREIVSLSLRLRADIDVRTSPDAACALRDAVEWQPNLVLTDVNMPGTDGVALLAALQRDTRTAAIPVVFLTAMHDADDLAALLSAGALAVLGKPFDPVTLGLQVVRLMGRQ
jgi:two-component system, OmpR family, response regulator